MKKIEGIFVTALYLNLVISIISLLLYFTYIGDLLISFLIKYLFFNLCLLVCLIWKKRIRSTLFVSIVILLQASLLFTSYGLPSGKISSLKIISANLFVDNTQRETVINRLVAQDADIIVLYEVNREWMALLNKGFSNYKTRRYFPKENSFGIALLSRHNLLKIEVDKENGFYIYFDYSGIGFMGIHPPPPLNSDMYELRNEIFQEAVELVEEKELKLIFGDFNAVPWSFKFKQFENAIGFSRVGFPFSTWNKGNLLFSLPLDNVMAENGGFVSSLKYIKIPGGDHSAILIEVDLTMVKASENEENPAQ